MSECVKHPDRSDDTYIAILDIYAATLTLHIPVYTVVLHQQPAFCRTPHYRRDNSMHGGACLARSSLTSSPSSSMHRGVRSPGWDEM